MIDVPDDLERGRESYARRAWKDAYMLGRDNDLSAPITGTSKLARRCVPRCAFWVGMQLSTLGEIGRGTGWLGRARRLVEHEERECVEQGYLLLPLMFQ